MAAADTYTAALAHAQALADRTGYDVGLERNEIFGTYEYRVLPRTENRRGFELRCEVVRPTTAPHTGQVPNGWVELASRKRKRRRR